jgi:poly(A) polymerase
LLLRYGASTEGKIEKKAHIYTRGEHGIEPGLVDADAMWVLRRLRKAGFHAYVVGGAVRDLMIGRKPNDFDVATDALPQQIRRLFHSARIVGRRFKIVHVDVGHGKFIEVTTFRSNKVSGSNNLFGTMEEDARRRDFTINALYYYPPDGQVFDYVGGFTDIRKRRLKTLIPAETSFAEDPVRMIRAVKYASFTGFPVPMGMGGLIKRLGESILTCSRERVTEEVYKILVSGNAAGVLELSSRFKLFEVIFPAIAEDLKVTRRRLADSPLYDRVKALDADALEGRELPRERMFEFLFRDLVRGRAKLFHDPDPAMQIQYFIREAAYPLFPSKRDLAVASHALLRENRSAGGGSERKSEAHAGERPPLHTAHRTRRRRRRR